EKTPVEQKFRASVFSWPVVLPQEFVINVRKLEEALDKEIWLLVQGGPHGGPFGMVDFNLLDAFTRNKMNLPKPQEKEKDGKAKSKMALLIHSKGGYAEPAYRIARLLQKRCAGFTSIVPQAAMSAATLLTLGANSIVLGEDAELGPLDAQFFDYDDAEQMVS